MFFLNAEQVQKALPMSQAIEAMKAAYATLSNGRAEVPQRVQIPIPAQRAVSLFMPAYVDDPQEPALAIKIVSVFPGNAEKRMPIIQAAVLVLDAKTGEPVALLEGSTLTAIRTGAASGAATDILARPESQIAAIFGAGVQGKTQLAAICTVRQIRIAWIYDSDPDRVRTFIDQMSAAVPAELRPAQTSSQAVEQADIICTATTSSTPVFDHQDLKPGVHINAIGAYTPEMQEIPSKTVQKALVFVDQYSAALEEAGDLIQPIQRGEIQPEHIRAELGEILLGRKTGRTRPNELTLFKSVGVAVQDAMAAKIALKNASSSKLGQKLNW